MEVRGKRAAETRQRILEATRELFATTSSEFTLANVAVRAETSVQTVLRAFGNKDALVREAIGSIRATVPPREERPRSVGEGVTRLFDDYEEIGERVIGMLAEEHRIPGLEAVAAAGRENHRAWVEAAFAEPLARHPARTRGAIVVALIAATDVYVWKLLRRDLGLDRKAAEAAVKRLIDGLLNDDRGR